MAPQKGVTVVTTDFPPYSIRMVGDSHFLIAGGGGQAKTGVPNAIEIYELRPYDGSCIAKKVKTHETSSGAVMNSYVVASKDKQFTAAVGIDDQCHVYSLRSKLVTPKTEGNVSDGLRKRKGKLTESSSHNIAAKSLSFELFKLGAVHTDFSKREPFQKVVCITSDGSLMATGGADGELRTWKFPDLKKLYETKAHTDEIDDLHINPSGNKIVTVSRDGKAFIWNTKDGSKHQELHWGHRKDVKYRFRSCRFASVSDKKDAYSLYTTHIPCTRGKNPAPCYLTKWDTTKFIPKKFHKTGTEVLSSFAVSDDGVYLGLGTLTGSVSIHIAFSLQRLYHLREVHGIFVTGLEFASSSEACASITGNHDVTLFSISADKQVKMHQVGTRQDFSPIWIIVGFLLCLYVIYWIITTLGL